MKRTFQNDQGTIEALNGERISRFICLQSRDDDSGRLHPCIFLLKTAEGARWHRFYLDAGICCWDEYDQLPQDDFADPESYPWVDLGPAHQLNGLRITSIGVTPHLTGVRLALTVSDGRTVEICTRHPEDDTRIAIDSCELKM